MKSCYIPLIGRFGNQAFQFAFAKAYAEQNGLELHTPRWIGEKIFQIEPTPEKQPDDVILGGYCQNQASLIYTRKQAKEWFKFRLEIEEKLQPFNSYGRMIAHIRRGDFEGYGYPTISRNSYHRTAEVLGLYDVIPVMEFASDEQPSNDPYFEKFAPFLPDFYRLMTASILLRANSSFSYWAAVLGNGRVFSPVIENLKGGQENDCIFMEGNWPKLSETVDCANLDLREG